MSTDRPDNQPAALGFRVLRGCRGRALYADGQGALYRSLHYRIHCSRDDGLSWQFVGAVPRPLRRKLIEPVRLFCRMVRHEVRGLLTLSDGALIVAVRSGVYHGRPGQRRLERATTDADAEDIRFPTTISAGPGDRIVWGEYWGNHGRREVRVMVSTDRGRSYQTAYVFAPREIRHVHSLQYDPAQRGYWLFAGDHGEEPGIGLLAEDFSRFDWLVKGHQKYRAVCAFDRGDHLVYGTDTELMTNGIYRLEKASGRLELLSEIGGSCIYATRCGSYDLVSSTVERIKGEGRFSRDATLYASADGDRWQPVYAAAKDGLSYKYFQFGSLVLPRGQSPRNVVMFSGQAVRGIDGRTLIAELTADGRA